MRRVFNLLDGELEQSPLGRDGHRLARKQLTQLFDTTLTGLSVYELPPGEAAWPYHYELQREEWLIVVSGEVVVRSPEGERTLRGGDVACFPPGESGAHAVRNGSSEPARFAMPSSFAPHAYVAVRPDSNTALIVGPGFRRIVPLDEEREFWEGEP